MNPLPDFKFQRFSSVVMEDADAVFMNEFLLLAVIMIYLAIRY
jgi:hypothetical protein